MADSTSNSAATAITKYDTVFQDIANGLLIPIEKMSRDVTSMFDEGTTFNSSFLGDVSIQDVAEKQVIPAQAIQAVFKSLSINKQTGGKHGFSKDIMEDNPREQDAKVLSFVKRAAYKTASEIEQHAYDTIDAIHTPGSVNNYLGQDRRVYADDANNRFTVQDILNYLYTLAESDRETFGLVGILPSSAFSHVNNSVTFTSSIDRTVPQLLDMGILKGDMRSYLGDVMGVQLYTTNKLTKYLSTSGTAFNGAANPGHDIAAALLFSAQDDEAKPLMHAMRRRPEFENWYDENTRQWYKQVTTRYGMAEYQKDFLKVIGIRNTV